ncbi:ADP-ribose pyrophosphatase [Ectothiorhodosinus mongolicus]|uniref:ADP-ribose pyrophosphatase n=1 Tax=Ectothiorhodosinus mongolicus TaxID=233100 RepID=A0A1R3VSG7_9GAMM|nr:NUDIX domain-containing protein [Ectothiorhodosinus mongolicus]ULX56488.1 ADP-ribose diphosphatase [Ectothiorhodosinus mongolicus]SIT66099.1 ADP-ribose pyrophosphatase [Ectothiorhodosinus mongolicus]
MNWKLLNQEMLYDGFFKLRRLQLSHSRFAGGEPIEVQRELLDRGHAAGVLPYDPIADRVLLIEQFRVGALESPHSPWLIEIIAGMIGPGENPQEVVRREALEEANCPLQELVHVHDYYSSPGGTSERITIYVANADLTNAGGIHGLEYEGEDIRTHVLDAEEAFELLRQQRIDNAMGVIALQWLMLHREQIQAQWT